MKSKAQSEITDVLAWLEDRARNSTSFGSHCNAYEVAALKLREALPPLDRQPKAAFTYPSDRECGCGAVCENPGGKLCGAR